MARGFLPESRSQQTASKDPFHAEPILFGEVAKQPPDVNLKRRHWTNHESNSYSRHADLFQKHLQIGEAQLKAVAQRTHTTVRVLLQTCQARLNIAAHSAILNLLDS